MLTAIQPGLAKEAQQTVQKPIAPKSPTPIAKTDRVLSSPYRTDAVINYNRALELHQNGYFTQAISRYKSALRSDDRINEAWNNLAIIYLSQNKLVQATEAFRKALLLKPNQAVTLNGYAIALYRSGHAKSAEEEWRKAIKADPSFTAAYYNLAHLLTNTGRNQEAQELLKAGGLTPLQHWEGDFVEPSGFSMKRQK
jgi:tetratricopeptide (TPR) repeat protein